MGEYPNIKSSFLQLMKNLAEYTGEVPQWRIGGNSADKTWWNPSGLPNPPNITYSIKESDLLTYNTAAQNLSTKMVLSVNFRNASSANWAVSHIEGISSTIGWDNIFAIEIGNECDLYGENGIRPQNWNYTYYSQQFEEYYKAITNTNVSPSVPFIQGATWCCLSSFLEHVAEYMTTYKSILRTFSYHKYPRDVCNGLTTNLIELMQDRAASGEAQALKPYVSDAIQLGVDFWMGEVNSVACGGAYNVSNTMGSALWTLDYLFNFANISVEGMNFHGGTDGAYSSFTYSPSTSNVPVVHPEYYGFYLFAQAIQNGAALTPITTHSTNNTYVKVWATKGTRDNSVRVVILHKDINSTTDAKVDISLDTNGYDENAVYYVLSAPSAYSTSNLTIGGQTFDNTPDGSIVGQRTAQTLQSVANVYTVTIKPSTAVLLVISPLCV